MSTEADRAEVTVLAHRLGLTFAEAARLHTAFFYADGFVLGSEGLDETEGAMLNQEAAEIVSDVLAPLVRALRPLLDESQATRA